MINGNKITEIENSHTIFIGEPIARIKRIESCTKCNNKLRICFYVIDTKKKSQKRVYIRKNIGFYCPDCWTFFLMKGE